MKKIRFALLLALTFCLLTVTAVYAQSETLRLSISRDWGSGGFNGDIQGLFSMHVSGPENLVKVEFYIDDTKIGDDTQSAFALQFNTDDYGIGMHTLYALGTTSDGQQLRSNEVTSNFVTAQSAGESIFPILAVVLLAFLGSVFVPFLVTRGKHSNLLLGAERNYGIRGGSICPKCHRPFALPSLSAHVGFFRLVVCPYCGKLNLAQAQPIEKLREAERAELKEAQAGQIAVGETEEEKLKKELDNSKYQGM
jgi:hypothetical protein